MTSLSCTVCGATVDQCACPDIDARLRKSFHDPTGTYVMAKWCRRCDKHYARCTCERPDFYILSAGQDISHQTFRMADGTIVVPDLTRK